MEHFELGRKWRLPDLLQCQQEAMMIVAQIGMKTVHEFNTNTRMPSIRTFAALFVEGCSYIPLPHPKPGMEHFALGRKGQQADLSNILRMIDHEC